MYRPVKVIAGAAILLGIVLMAHGSTASASDRFDVTIAFSRRTGSNGSSIYTVIPGQPRKSSPVYRRSITYRNIKEPKSDYIVVSLLSPGGNDTGQSFQGIFEDADDADGKTVTRRAELKTRNASARVVVHVREVD